MLLWRHQAACRVLLVGNRVSGWLSSSVVGSNENVLIGVDLVKMVFDCVVSLPYDDDDDARFESSGAWTEGSVIDMFERVSIVSSVPIM